MSSGLSRRKIAKYVAEEIVAGRDAVIDELAALLVAEGREREAETLVRDIEFHLGELGTLVVAVETARTLEAATKREIERMFAGKTVVIREVVRPELVGGVRIITPSQLLDQTIAHQLNKLRMAEV